MSRTAENIRRLRASGLTQMEISRRTNIPQHKLSRWGAGRTPASVDAGLVLQDLANELAPQVNSAPLTQPIESAHA